MHRLFPQKLLTIVTHDVLEERLPVFRADRS